MLELPNAVECICIFVQNCFENYNYTYIFNFNLNLNLIVVFEEQHIPRAA